jgi:DNA polymerase-3 subunit alpha
VLGETYGLIVYQEQVMLIAQKLAGYTLGKADLLRKAMGKKKREVLDAEFVGSPRAWRPTATRWRRSRRCGTSWSRSPTTRSTRRTARLRPGVLLDGLPQGQLPGRVHGRAAHQRQDDKDKSALYLNECRRMGIKVLPPDVNESDADYTPRGTDIRFGLSAIRNVGENVVASIAGDPRRPRAVHRLLRLPAQGRPVACNKKTVESLIKAGAFDSLGDPRRGLLNVHAEAIDSFMATKRNEAHGQFDLFGGDDADGRRRLVVTRDPDRGVGEERPAPVRAGDARPLRLRPPAVRRRARLRRAPTARSPR